MATVRLHFTTRVLTALASPAAGHRAYYYDDQARSLCIDVTHAGTKTFYLVRKVNGRVQRIRLGRFPEMTVANARTEAAIKNNDLDRGLDLQAEKRKTREELTLGELFDIYFERHAKLFNKRPDNQLGNFKRYLSVWKNRVLSSILKEDVHRHFQKLAISISPRTATIMLTLLRTLYNRGHDWNLWQGDDPTRGIKKIKSNERDRYLTADELPRFMRALRSEANTDVRDAVYLLLYTGVRRGNMLSMRWEQIELGPHEPVWRIPDTKAGEPQRIALTPQAVTVLKRRYLEAGAPRFGFVFAGPGKRGHLDDPKKAWQRICARAGLANFRIHDLRHTFASYLAMTNANQFLVSKALGHKTLASSKRYIQLPLSSLRQASDKAITAMLALADTDTPTETHSNAG